MAKRRASALAPKTVDIEGALAALDAPALRALVGEMLVEVDDATRALLVRSLVDRAARAASGWAPPPLAAEDVSEILTFVKAASRVGHADPSEVDDYLGRGSDAFLRKDYAGALRIFGALLEPIGEGEIDLGQDELVQEALGTDLRVCATQYVVSAYMTSGAPERPEAVRSAIRKVHGAAYFHEPVSQMEAVAVEPLPGLDEFLVEWRGLIEKEVHDERSSSWDANPRSWLREVARRTEGVEGLARVARSSKSVEDLRAWCESLVEVKDWEAALSAFEEAADLVGGREYARGDFLDGAALAAQELGRKDVPARLERAWRSDPSMARLCRWLASAGSTATVKKRAGEALHACPKDKLRQRALLQVLQGDLPSAAKLLAVASGLGWSEDEHPGHLLFPLFKALLASKTFSPAALRLRDAVTELDVLDGWEDEDDESEATSKPRLATPDLRELLALGGLKGVTDAAGRGALLEGMRKAAAKRVAGVTEHKRRRYYGHAAELVAAVVECDPSPKTARWVDSLREKYRRFYALREALDRRLGSTD